MPTVNLRLVLLSIQDLLSGKHPLAHEPSYENCAGSDGSGDGSDGGPPTPARPPSDACVRYSRIVTYETLVVAIYRMLTDVPAGFEFFLPQMKKLFLRAYDKLVERLRGFELDHRQISKTSTYGPLV